ncbi:hypothetical protein CEXT_197651 [Caerostris extrusa]|uniref:Uncharacterized protein n=1 Tax=Caerostris extrusa TaxID=172846 RepID=A0AAV4XQB9_CAEEX|nr:hypothetical protein CEXT_197651 [Caerostris extrusa]
MAPTTRLQDSQKHCTAWVLATKREGEKQSLTLLQDHCRYEYVDKRFSKHCTAWVLARCEMENNHSFLGKRGRKSNHVEECVMAPTRLQDKKKKPLLLP